MTASLDASMIRIRTAVDQIVGAGFLVGDCEVLTCAHVVADALRLPRDTQETPTTKVHLDFPLVAARDILTYKESQQEVHLGH